MKVAKNTVVTMTYVLHRETADGEVIQETTKEQPFQAIFGQGMLLPKFEENLDGLEPG
ncbi:MAG: FKBP-type peptidyl-prolyl cis-trans isomerase, partial [Bacteroidales bacterium]|nr:FKBP-type peptidyl-prolyl cis-trans isomerase [Bacteroidales bacterium]